MISLATGDHQVRDPVRRKQTTPQTDIGNLNHVFSLTTQSKTVITSCNLDTQAPTLPLNTCPEILENYKVSPFALPPTLGTLVIATFVRKLQNFLPNLAAPAYE